MSYITRTGNLAKTPELREGEKSSYAYARVLVTDRVRKEDGTYADGATIGYEVLVSGSQAVELVDTAERSGNVRVMFAGSYRVTEWEGENGTRVQHEVRADEIGISLRSQSVTVERKQNSNASDAEAFDTSTF